jgi:hypothetical protein
MPVDSESSSIISRRGWRQLKAVVSAGRDGDSASDSNGWPRRAWVAIVGAAAVGVVGGGFFVRLVLWPDVVVLPITNPACLGAGRESAPRYRAIATGYLDAVGLPGCEGAT